MGRLLAARLLSLVLFTGSLAASADDGSSRFLLSVSAGNARTLIVDAEGDIESLGPGPGSVASFSACPGGKFFAELVVLAPGRSQSVAVRSASSLEVQWEEKLSSLDSWIEDVSCRDGAGEAATVFLNGSSGTGLVERVSAGGLEPLYEVESRHAVIEGNRLYGWTDDELLIHDLRTGDLERRVPLSFAPYFAATSPGGGVAVIEVGGGRVEVVDQEADSQPVVRRTSLPQGEYRLEWVGADGFAILPEEPPEYRLGEGPLFLDRNLRQLGVIESWPSPYMAAIDGEAFAGDPDGFFVSAELPDGAARRVNKITDGYITAIEVLTSSKDAGSSPPTSFAWLPVLVLGAVVAIGSVLYRRAAGRSET